jgi:hypothetical protein
LKIHGKLEHKTDRTLHVNEHSSDYKARQASMIDSIQVKIKRNLAGYPLCPGLNKEQRQEILEKAKKAFM